MFQRESQSGFKGEDIRIEVVVPLQKIITGTDEEIHISHLKVCPLCNGLGTAYGTKPRTCKTCNGTGQLINTIQEGNISYQEIRTCPECEGRGNFIDTPCSECAGIGTINEPEVLTVTIPIGAEDGMVLRVPEHGKASPKPNGKPGDLMVIVYTAYNPDFNRDGADLWHTQTIELIDAVLGTEIEISTLEEPLKVTIPQGTQPNTVLRLSEKGLPYFEVKQRGDLYLRINVHIPENLNDEKKELYTKLRKSEHK